MQSLVNDQADGLEGPTPVITRIQHSPGATRPRPLLTFYSVTWPNPNGAAIVFLSYSVEQCWVSHSACI